MNSIHSSPDTPSVELTILFTGDLLSNPYIRRFSQKQSEIFNPQTKKKSLWKAIDYRKKLSSPSIMSSFEEIQKEVLGLPSNLVVLCVTESISNSYPSFLIKTFFSFYLPKIPFFIFSTTNPKDNQSSLDDFKLEVSKKMSSQQEDGIKQIFLLSHNDLDNREVMMKMFDIFCYYHQLGEGYQYPGEIREDCNNIHYSLTLNIIITGCPGEGKSTLINTLLDEQKAFAGRGLSHTNHVSKYYHKKYPLIIYDTPGLEKTTVDTILNFIKTNTNKSKCLPRNQIHLLVYVKSRQSRYLLESEKPFLLEINKIKDLPVFYVITHSTSKDMQFYKQLFENDYKPIIKQENQNNIYYTNLVYPFFDIELFVEGLFVFMLNYPSFISYLSNSEVISIDLMLKTARNQVFKKLLEQKSYRNQITNSPEIKRVVNSFLKEIQFIYNLVMNEEWTTTIEQNAKISFEKIDLQNSFLMNDIYYIEKEITEKIDHLNYLTHIAIAACRLIEDNIKQNGKLFNKTQYVYNYFALVKEQMVIEMLNISNRKY